MERGPGSHTRCHVNLGTWCSQAHQLITLLINGGYRSFTSLTYMDTEQDCGWNRKTVGMP